MDKSVAILGGTFDPVHNGHIFLAEKAHEELGYGKVLLMPANISPFKRDRKMASEKARIDMLKLASEGKDYMSVSLIEIRGSGVSYTYDTLTSIRDKYPDGICFITGADAFMTLETWSKGKNLLTEFAIAVSRRPGEDDKELERTVDYYVKEYGTKVHVFGDVPPEISSTEIRERVKQGKSIKKMVAPEVERYIHDRKLYL